MKPTSFFRMVLAGLVGLAFCLAALSPPPAYGQIITTATVSGVTSDPSGAVIPNAKVVAKNRATGLEYTATTNERGEYLILNLPPAFYDLSASVTGFQTAVQSNVQLLVNQRVTRDFTLAVGAMTQTVEVTGAAPMLETGSAALGQVIQSRQIVDLPLNGRQFTQLLLLIPGVNAVDQKQDITPGIGPRTSQLSSNSAFSPGVNGMPSRSNLYIMDGASNTNPFFTSFQVAPNIDSIQEFKLETHHDQAEVGQARGGVINIITKSGGDSVHGTVYEFNRNKATAANGFINNSNKLTQPQFNQNQFGFTVGGPVVIPKVYDGHGKMWVFGQYEGYRFVQSAQTLTRVAMADERVGDFSNWLRPTPTGRTDALGRPVLQGQIFNPFTSRLVLPGQVDPGVAGQVPSTGLVGLASLPAAGVVVREPFPGNKIPQSLFNPITAYMDPRILPTGPNLPVAAGLYTSLPNFVNPNSNTLYQNQWSVRMDKTWGMKDTVYGRFSLSDTTGKTQASLPLMPGVNVFDARVAAVNWLHSFSPTAIAQVTMGWNRINTPSGRVQPCETSFIQVPSEKGCVQEIFNKAQIGGSFKLGAANFNLPSVGAGDFFPSMGSFGGTKAFLDTWQLGGNFTKIAGRHTLKMGVVDHWIIQSSGRGGCPGMSFDQFATADPNNVTFGQIGTGRPGASFLLGLTSGGLVYSNANAGTVRDMHVGGGYIQDSWKASRKLTINFGIRYDITAPPVERNNIFNNFGIRQNQFLMQRAGFPACTQTNNLPPCIPGAGVLPDFDVPWPAALLQQALAHGHPAVLKAKVSVYPHQLHDTIKDNWQPRFGFAYKANDRTVVRGGIGWYFDNWASQLQLGADAGGPWPLGFTRSLSNQNRGLIEATAQNILSTVSGDPFRPPLTPFPAGAFMTDTHFRNGYVAGWNFEVQRQFTNTLTVTVSYVGSKSQRNYIGFMNNAATSPGPGPIAPRTPWPLGERATFTELNRPDLGFVPNPDPAARAAVQRSWQDLRGARSEGMGTYNSLQVKIEQRLAKGASYLISYTWAKSIDTACSGYSGIEGCHYQSPYRILDDKSVSTYDITQHLVMSYIFELPFGKGRSYLNQGGPMAWIFGDWQINGIVEFFGGQPISISTGADTANVGYSQHIRPIQVGNPIPSDRNRLKWFDRSAFKLCNDKTYFGPSAPDFCFGTLGRNTLRSPYFQNFDFSVFRDFRLPGEKFGKIQFRAEFFNIFNKTNFNYSSVFSTSFQSTTFGQIFATYPARQVQFGAKWVF